MFRQGGLLFCKILAFWCAAVFSLGANANFEAAMSLYSNGKFDEAKKAFQSLAEIGDRTSLFNLGVMYYRAEGVERDPAKGYALMKIANDDLGDERFETLISSVYQSLTDDQKADFTDKYHGLKKIYGMDVIVENIFPKLLDDEDCDPGVKNIHSVKPVYPKLELDSRNLGYTSIEFTISPEGYPRDTNVILSASKRFTRTSVRALRKRLYDAESIDEPIYGRRIVITYHMKGVEYRTRKLSKDMTDLREVAEQGDAVAQYRYASRLNVFRNFKHYLDEYDFQYKDVNQWYLKAAKNGMPHAQFELGSNMLAGRGCAVDREGGVKWITAAAVSGYSPAQEKLAIAALEAGTDQADKSKMAMRWLENAVVGGGYPSRLLLAWELSTSPLSETRDGERALSLLDSENTTYFDDIRIAESRAAAYAEIGDFKKAVKYQKKAIKMAKKNDWKIPLLQERLTLYQDKKPFRGSYY